SEWEKPFPECVLPAPTNISNEHGNVNIQSARPVLEQTTEIKRLKGVKGCPNFADQDESLIIEGILPTYHLGDSITLSCPHGTELDPHVERITCLGDRWSETKLPHCLDRFSFRF
ncbi:unnamed protein product, partial [Ixodes pacificus]